MSQSRGQHEAPRTKCRSRSLFIFNSFLNTYPFDARDWKYSDYDYPPSFSRLWSERRQINVITYWTGRDRLSSSCSCHTFHPIGPTGLTLTCVRRRSAPDIDDGPSERNNSPSLSKYGSMCQGFARRFLCPIFRDPLHGERIAIRLTLPDSVPNRCIQAGQKRQSARRHRESPEYSTSQRDRKESQREEKERGKERKEIRFLVFGCYPMNPTTFGVVVDLTNCLSSFKTRDSLRLIITWSKRGDWCSRWMMNSLKFYDSFSRNGNIPALIISAL